MIAKHRHGVDRTVAEELLTGRPAWPTSADPRLLGLLAAVAAPPRQAELAGEFLAVEAFRNHYQNPIPDSEPLEEPGRRATRPLMVRLAAVSVGVASVGMAAVAGATGMVPEPIRDVLRETAGLAGKSPSAAPAPEASAGAAVRVTPDPLPGASRSPLPSPMGLCRAWLAQPVEERGKAADSPAFAALVTAAGGSERIDAYCASLVGVPSTAPGLDRPGVTGRSGAPAPPGLPAPPGRPAGVPERD